MMAIEGRKFLGRVVRFLVSEGVRQFVDIGCGLPTQNNAHEVAQGADPESRVVYVDIDPVVVTHARAILADDVRTTVVQADMREPEAILGHPDLQRLIDLKRPVAILLISALQVIPEDEVAVDVVVIPEDEVAVDVVTRLREALCPGSWMVISHPVSDSRPHVTRQLAALFQDEQIVKGERRRDNVRTQAEIEPYFTGLELAEPGMVRIPAWRPDRGEPSVDPDSVWTVAGVGRKP